MNTKLYTHLGHDGPWLLPKTQEEYKERIHDIKTVKPETERAARLCLIAAVRAPLPPTLQKVYGAWQQADAAWLKADAARHKEDAAWQQAYGAWQKEDAAWQQASAAWLKAYAARHKEDAAWLVAINSPEGVAFHAKVCGCSWSPEHPDTLEGLAR